MISFFGFIIGLIAVTVCISILILVACISMGGGEDLLDFLRRMEDRKGDRKK